MSPSFEPDGCAQVRRNPWILALSLVLLLGSLGAQLWVRDRPLWQVALWAVVMIPLSMSAVYAMNGRPWVRPARVRANARGVTIGERFVPRAAIRRGVVGPGDPPTVVLHLRGLRLPILLRTAGERDARALLEALGLDEAHTVAEFQAAPGVLVDQRLSLLSFPLFIGLMVLGWKLDLGLADWPTFVLLSQFPMLVVRPTWVGVGADGITLGWLWRRRFFGFDAILRVDRREKVLHVEHTSGERTVLPFSDEGELSRAEARIREAMDAFRELRAGGGPFRGSPERTRSPFLLRGERSLAEWAAALRALGTGPHERLFRIVEDPAAEVVDRAAAAVALAGALDGESRARLRAAADAVAAPRLRVALQKVIGSESEAESEAVLAELDADDMLVRRSVPQRPS